MPVYICKYVCVRACTCATDATVRRRRLGMLLPASRVFPTKISTSRGIELPLPGLTEPVSCLSRFLGTSSAWRVPVRAPRVLFRAGSFIFPFSWGLARCRCSFSRSPVFLLNSVFFARTSHKTEKKEIGKTRFLLSLWVMGNLILAICHLSKLIRNRSLSRTGV